MFCCFFGGRGLENKLWNAVEECILLVPSKLDGYLSYG
jgi:hypothetical protein